MSKIKKYWREILLVVVTCLVLGNIFFTFLITRTLPMFVTANKLVDAEGKPTAEFNNLVYLSIRAISQQLENNK